MLERRHGAQVEAEAAAVNFPTAKKAKSLVSYIQCSKNLAGLMASYPDDGRHTKAFGCADVVFQLEGFSASMHSINEREIKARRCAHLYEGGRRRQAHIRFRRREAVGAVNVERFFVS